MNKDKLRQLLSDFRQERLSLEEVLKRLENLPYEDLGFANIDHHRALRRGFPEVVFCQNKTPEQVVEIMSHMAPSQDVLATRVTPEIHKAVVAGFAHAEYNDVAKTIVIKQSPSRETPTSRKPILVCSAGTADMPVAEEAAVTAEVMGNPVERLYDVGVAGIHRLLDNKAKMDAANILVVVAGMDGVLPTVVSGLVAKPVIAVPTSVGYGASFQGIAPLLTMLNACSPGIAVMNIDNGFGAGYFASLINSQA
ncbi:nickel pincer cofactor biosynthesis protein LarB [candidate division KSB1 bacterium]|nr:nickel pincer cofactor biosynthesis protein LarB [candidate division KSB1 bacterium]